MKNLQKVQKEQYLKYGPSSNTYINIFDIREESIEESKGFLASKVQKLKGFFQLIFESLKDDEKAILEDKIIECYKMKGITFNDESLYKEENGIKKFKESKDMPILEDLYKLLKNSEETNKLAIELKAFIDGS